MCCVFAVQDVARLIEDSVNGGATRDPKVADGGWRVVVDDLTGTLVVTATPSQHSQVIAIMERLDAADGLVHPMRSYPIRNRPASEMQATLSRLSKLGRLDANERIAARESVARGASSASFETFSRPKVHRAFCRRIPVAHPHRVDRRMAQLVCCDKRSWVTGFD